MSVLVLMRAFEAHPRVFDKGMRLATGGQLTRIDRVIVERAEGCTDVLDLGCGTGRLLGQLADGERRLTGVDRSSAMLLEARNRLAAKGLAEDVQLRQWTALELDRRLPTASFDAIVLGMVLSELTLDERAWVLRDCGRMLRQGGRLLIADDVLDHSVRHRLLDRIVGAPLRLLTFLSLHMATLRTGNPLRTIYYIIAELPLILLSFLNSAPLLRGVSEEEFTSLEPGLCLKNQRRFAFGLRFVELVKTGAGE